MVVIDWKSGKMDQNAIKRIKGMTNRRKERAIVVGYTLGKCNLKVFKKIYEGAMCVVRLLNY